MSTPAHIRARLAGAQHAAAQTPIVSMLGAPPEGTPDGFSAWAVGPLMGPRHVVIVPTLADNAPPALLDRLVAHVLTIATGTCPLCGAVAGLLGPRIPDPESPLRGRAAYYLHALTIGVQHVGECPAAFGASDRRWFPVLHVEPEEGDR